LPIRFIRRRDADDAIVDVIAPQMHAICADADADAPNTPAPFITPMNSLWLPIED